MNWAEAFQRIREENMAKGVCPDCGGAGVVANMRAIARTGDPHVNQRCRLCRGNGLPRPMARSKVSAEAE